MKIKLKGKPPRKETPVGEMNPASPSPHYWLYIESRVGMRFFENIKKKKKIVSENIKLDMPLTFATRSQQRIERAERAKKFNHCKLINEQNQVSMSNNTVTPIKRKLSDSLAQKFESTSNFFTHPIAFRLINENNKKKNYNRIDEILF
jgi:hypothetical protein